MYLVLTYKLCGISKTPGSFHVIYYFCEYTSSTEKMRTQDPYKKSVG